MYALRIWYLPEIEIPHYPSGKWGVGIVIQNDVLAQSHFDKCTFQKQLILMSKDIKKCFFSEIYLVEVY